MNVEELTDRLTDATGTVRITRLGNNTFRVLLPSHRNVHDTIAIGLVRASDGWTLTDGGQLAYLMEDDFDKVVEAMECAGASFSTGGRREVESDVSDTSSLVSAILEFGYYLSAAPAVWHSLECLRSPQEQKPTAIDKMAAEVRQRLIDASSRPLSAFLHTKLPVRARGEYVSAPLAVTVRGAKRPPSLVAGFIDTFVSAQAVSSAKRTTSYMWEVVRDLRARRYLVVRGTQQEVEHFADFFDHYNIVTVSSEDLGTLPDDANAAVDELVGSR